ncbi:unnamed protein product [Penicillium salamii]|uniref:Uncharacterized protein n=1 Tax=Penicillium salamii TaxID=1612424 RepID=A0A9W4K033_9EURO|nr:unnamed protein product [Penicillium salamii]CAG8219129.1 unnamed protein product [Penicillium salamii]CAG8240338.1 unnamed protein product [Penicillium salamii]CAG8293539.1 unnamed protein product [Penicillium salamii]CAG8324700.1 unnamed protein product [Penicillium salamii]
MDGDQRKHEGSMSRSRTAPRRAPGRATESDPAIQPRGDPTGMSQPPDQAPMSYDYGYTASSFHGSLQSSDIPSYQDFVRGRQISALQRRRVPEYYDSMIYGFQGPTPGPFEVVPQYQNRPAAMDLATQFVPQYFAEESAESGVAGLSPSLYAPMPYNQPNPMVRPNTTQSFPSNIPDFTAIGSGSMNRLDQEPQQSDPSSLEEAIGQYQHLLRQTFDQTRAGRLAEAGASLTQISEWLVTNARELGKMMLFLLSLDFVIVVHFSSSIFPHLIIRHPKSSGVFFFISLLFSVFSSSFLPFQMHRGSCRAQSTLGVGSNTKVVLPTGLLRDDSIHYPDRLELWSNFNLCWLAVCQKQKDLLQDLIASGHQSTQVSLIRRDRMESMGTDLIQLCDQLEQHGLVDYQMGIWEEEILSVLSQCLDLMEGSPELHHIPAIPEPRAAVPRP